MNTNEKVNVILALREYAPGLNLKIESGISPVVVRLNGVFIGDADYMLSVTGCGDTFDEALNNLYARISNTDDGYVIIDSELMVRPVGLRYLNNTWIPVKEFNKK